MEVSLLSMWIHGYVLKTCWWYFIYLLIFLGKLTTLMQNEPPLENTGAP